MSTSSDFAKAFFQIVENDSGSASGDKIDVHFNPTSLQHTVTNTLQNTGRGAAAKQYVSQSTAKLTMDLLFDTTGTGTDVRLVTSKIAKLMQPTRAIGSSQSERDRKVPPLVLFDWGNFTFKGMVENFKETIDFFSGNGVPLRASVNLTMSQQDQVFADPTTEESASVAGSLALDAIEVPPSANQSPASAAAQGGDPSAAKDIATTNNLESLRFANGAPLTVNPTAPPRSPSAFSGGSAIGGGSGIAGAFGGGASAGVSASGGAFAGLRASAGTQGSGLLDPNRFLKNSGSAGIATDSGATFSVGGKAIMEGSPSLSADVGAKTDLRERIQFDSR